MRITNGKPNLKGRDKKKMSIPGWGHHNYPVFWVSADARNKSMYLHFIKNCLGGLPGSSVFQGVELKRDVGVEPLASKRIGACALASERARMSGVVCGSCVQDLRLPQHHTIP